MRKDRLFQILVLADVALSTLTIGAELIFHSTLPEPLRQYAGAFWSGWGVMSVALFVFWIAIVLVTIISWVGLLLFWWPARAFYTGAWGAMLLLLLLSGPSVLTGPGVVLDTLEHIISGIVIGMMFFSEEVKQKFEESDLVPAAT